MQIAARRAFLTQEHRLALVWRLLSYLFLFIVVNVVANVARVVLESVGVPSVIGRLVFTLLYISGTLGLTYGYRRFIDRRSWQGIALPPLQQGLRDIAVGVVLGILMVALVFGFESAAGWIQVVGSEGGTGALTLLADSLLVSLAFGVCEEISMRGYLFQNLGEGRPIWMAIIIGLGVVVQYDRHLLHLTRTVSVSAEYLLSMVVVIMGILLFLTWARLRNHHLSWHSTLTEDGQLQAPEAQPSTVEQGGWAVKEELAEHQDRRNNAMNPQSSSPSDRRAQGNEGEPRSLEEQRAVLSMELFA